jgi:phage tail sheath protein FI
MAENFSVAELVVPGTYIRVRSEGLIGAGGIATGNIGIVGTATNADNPSLYGRTHILSDFESATEVLGASDAFSAGTLNLTRGLSIAFNNGARKAYVRALDPAGTPDQADYTTQFNELVKDDVNILIAPELSTTDALSVLRPILETTENHGKDMMAVIGADGADVAAIAGQVVADDRVIMTAPGIRYFDPAEGATVDLPANYTAAAIAGLLGTLVPQSSPTNKTMAGVTELRSRFSYGEVTDLISGGILVLEDRLGIRVVRGVSTEMASNGPFRQITTRRITDFAKAGIRQVSNPFIGRLNNERVRKALRGAIDGFLASMVQDESLIGYSLEVTATRDDEINGRAVVRATIQPTFSIDFVAVTMVLE